MPSASELPSGTVTFLFTDIEGSTRLLKQLGRQRYGVLLARHNELLRSVFRGRGGLEVDRHLTILHQGGMVARQKQGKYVVYELADMHTIASVAAAASGLAKQSSDVASLTAKAAHAGRLS
jgi:class 3 adenylate cyclase